MSKEKRNGFVDDTKRQVWIDGRFFEAIPKGERLIGGDVLIILNSLSIAPAGMSSAEHGPNAGHYREVKSVDIFTRRNIRTYEVDHDSWSSEARAQLDKLLPPPMELCPYQEWRKTQPKEALAIVDALASVVKRAPFGVSANALHSVMGREVYDAYKATL